MAVTPFKSSDNFNMSGFNEKITEADNTYVAKTGDSMTGALSMGNNKITDVASPVNDGDAATKGYVDKKAEFYQILNYTGNGTNDFTLTFKGTPRVIIITSALFNGNTQGDIGYNGLAIGIVGSTAIRTGYFPNQGREYGSSITWGNNKVTISQPDNYLNYKNYKYLCFAILA